MKVKLFFVEIRKRLTKVSWFELKLILPRIKDLYDLYDLYNAISDRLDQFDIDLFELLNSFFN